MATRLVFDYLTGETMQIDVPDQTNFNHYHVFENERVVVPIGQEMITTRKKLIIDGTLIIDGQVSLI